MDHVPLHKLDDHDGWHPRTEFEGPTEENYEEELRRELARASAVLDPKIRGIKVREDVKLFQLRKVFDLLAHVFGAGTGEKPKQDSTLAELLEFCWQPGRDGFATANSETAFMRFGAASWCFRQDWFHATSQRMFGVSLKDDAQLRCPNCVARNKLVQNFTENYAGDFAFDFLRSLIGPTSFTHGEMKKQSINRHVIDFTDLFGVRNQHMRTSSAREKFRRLAALKKAKPQLDYSI